VIEVRTPWDTRWILHSGDRRRTCARTCARTPRRDEDAARRAERARCPRPQSGSEKVVLEVASLSAHVRQDVPRLSPSTIEAIAFEGKRDDFALRGLAKRGILCYAWYVPAV